MNTLLSTVPRVALSAIAASALFMSGGTGSAQTILIDFGPSGTGTTIKGNAPDDPLNFWNNITDSVATTSTGSLLNLVTTANDPTSVDFFMLSRFSASNSNGTTSSTLYAADATRDSFYGHSGTFNSMSATTPSFKFSDLDLTKSYNFTFYASRIDATQASTVKRETVYTLSGGISGSVTLEVLNNVNNSVTYFGMTPNALGEIIIDLTAGANDHVNKFVYAGVIELVAVPEPTTTFLLAIGCGALCMRRRRATVARG